METKASIRKQILALRNAMSRSDIIEKSRRITEHLLCLPLIEDADVILCYASYKSEVDTIELLSRFWELGKKVYLPKVSGEEMDFYLVQSMDDISDGYKGIPEPKNSCEKYDEAKYNKNHTVMLLPGAAFSEKGARIGYGKGYYDRYLSRLLCQNRIALCYEFQVVNEIESDAHDIPVTMLVTDEKIRTIMNQENKSVV